MKESVPSTPSTAAASPLVAQPAGPDGHRKSNWQVIEHFSSTKDKGSLSSSLIAVSNLKYSRKLNEQHLTIYLNQNYNSVGLQIVTHYRVDY